jgi:hypothetical protein
MNVQDIATFVTMLAVAGGGYLHMERKHENLDTLHADKTVVESIQRDLLYKDMDRWTETLWRYEEKYGTDCMIGTPEIKTRCKRFKSAIRKLELQLGGK